MLIRLMKDVVDPKGACDDIEDNMQNLAEN